MKQRSLSRSTEPKQLFLACVRRQYFQQSYESKDSTHGTQRLTRNSLKKIYKQQKKKDAEIGLKINNLFKELFYETHLIKTGKEPNEETIEYLKNLAEQIKTLKQQERFRVAFPSFAAFKRYIRKEKVTLKDLRELE